MRLFKSTRRTDKNRSPSIRGLVLRTFVGVAASAAAFCLALDFVVLPQMLRSAGLEAFVRDDLLGTFVRQAWIHNAFLLFFVISVVAWVAVRIGNRVGETFSEASRSLSTAGCDSGRDDRAEDTCEARELVHAASAIGRDLDLTRRALHDEQVRARVLNDERTAGLRLALRRLADKDRVRDEFVARVSHEFRSPLASIRSFAEILRRYRKTEDPGTIDEFLTIIQRESDRLSRLITDLLDLSCIETGRVSWNLEPVDLPGVLREASQAIRGLCETKGHRLDVDIPRNLPPARADRDRLTQVVSNLLARSLEGMHAPGRIRVAIEVASDNGLNVVVEDTGRRIPEDTREAVLEGLATVQADETAPVKDLDLGLRIVTEIVRWHGGRIWIEDSALGGSRFVMTCPQWVETLPDRAPPRRLPTALIVSDGPERRGVLRRALAAAGCLTAETSPEEVLHRARTLGPDLVIVDLVSHRLSSLDALRELRDDPELAEIPVLMVALRALPDGGYGHAVSAFVPEAHRGGELVQTVESLEAASMRPINTILVTGGNDQTRQVVATTLSHTGRDVTQDPDGDTVAADRLTDHDLILLDLSLPRRLLSQALQMATHSQEMPPIVLTCTEPRSELTHGVWPVFPTTHLWPDDEQASMAASALVAMLEAETPVDEELLV